MDYGQRKDQKERASMNPNGEVLRKHDNVKAEGRADLG